MTGKSIQFAAIAVLMNRQKNFMIVKFTILPSNLKKAQIKIYVVLNHFSILPSITDTAISKVIIQCSEINVLKLKYA